MPNGKIQKEHLEKLQAMGQWLQENGATIYGTRNTELSLGDNMVATAKGDKIYLHLMDLEMDRINIPNFDKKIAEIVFFKDRAPLKYTLKKGTLSFGIPKEKIDGVDTILEIRIK
jgi:alpha-L-fucosidase